VICPIAQPGLPDENFNRKPNSANKTPEKSQTKSQIFCGIAIPLPQGNI